MRSESSKLRPGWQVYGLLGEGSVIGVIPAALEPREVSGAAVGEVRIVPDMHTRKVGAQPLRLRI